MTQPLDGLHSKSEFNFNDISPKKFKGFKSSTNTLWIQFKNLSIKSNTDKKMAQAIFDRITSGDSKHITDALICLCRIGKNQKNAFKNLLKEKAIDTTQNENIVKIRNIFSQIKNDNTSKFENLKSICKEATFLLEEAAFLYLKQLLSKIEVNEKDPIKTIVTSLLQTESIDGNETNLTQLLHWASVNGNTNLVRALIATRADFNSTDMRGRTPLHNACTRGIVNTLVNAGASITYKDPNGRTPLHYACNAEVINALLLAGIRKNYIGDQSLINLRDNYGRTPLHNASNKEVVDTLINAKASVTDKDTNKRTPLHNAQNKEVATALIDIGANVIDKDESRMTPLHVVCTNGKTEVVEVIIGAMKAKGISINEKDNYGRTALHYARSKKAVEILVAAGIDVNVKDNDEKTALDMAKLRHKEVAQALTDKIASVD